MATGQHVGPRSAAQRSVVPIETATNGAIIRTDPPLTGLAVDAGHAAALVARLTAYSELTGLAGPLKSLARTTAQACGVHRCSIFMTSDGFLIPVMSQLASGERQEHLWRTFMTLGPYRVEEIPAFARAIAERRPVVLPEPGLELAVPGQWKTFGAASGALIPLLGECGVVGMMVLDSHAPEITREQVRRTRGPSRSIASVIDGALTVIEMRDQLRDAETIVSLSRTMRATQEVQDVVRRITELYARAARVAMDAERARVDNLLHDTVRQTLFTIALRIERSLRGRQPTSVLRDYLREIKHDVGLIMTQINQLIVVAPALAAASESSTWAESPQLTDGSGPPCQPPRGQRPQALATTSEESSC
jgi:signal transduction histidine kinase